MTIDVLSDNVLVEIFFHVQHRWRALVHVCRRWRYLVFASPRRLNLRLQYRGCRPVSKVLETWPVLPVVLVSWSDYDSKPWDNVVAVLGSEYQPRISEIYIENMTASSWETFAKAMQKPFPALTHLTLSVSSVYHNVISNLPDSSLGGSAPLLRKVSLRGIPIPSIPEVLLSANGLVTLALNDIPNSGYFSPDAMATALTVMTRLESLQLTFCSPRSHRNPASRPLPPLTRFVLPALTKLTFEGGYDYLEDLLSQIDSPLIYVFQATFFMDLSFDVPQLSRLIGHAEELKAFDRAHLMIDDLIWLGLYQTPGVDHRGRLNLRISDTEVYWKLSSLVQVCSSLSVLSTVEALEIVGYQENNLVNARWLRFLDRFTALKRLNLTGDNAQHICGVLGALSGERATEVLPALRNLFVRGFESLQPVEDTMKSFLAARKLSGNPVVIDHW